MICLGDEDDPTDKLLNVLKSLRKMRIQAVTVKSHGQQVP